MDYTEITSRIVVGDCPREGKDIDQLREDTGISAVINLQTDGDFSYCQVDWDDLKKHYGRSNIEIRRVPVLDFNRDDLRKRLPDCVQALHVLIHHGHKVFVHCNSGINRAPSVAIAYPHWIMDMAFDEAIHAVRRLRKCDPYVDAIQAATEEWKESRRQMCERQ